MSARSPIVASPLPERSTPTTPVPADAAMHLDAPLLELPRDQFGGAMLLQTELRIGVDVMPDGGQLAVVAGDRLDRQFRGGMGTPVRIGCFEPMHHPAFHYQRIQRIDDLAVQHDAFGAAQFAFAEGALRGDADLIDPRLARRRLDARDKLRQLPGKCLPAA